MAGLFSSRFFRPILDIPGPVGAVWNRTGFEKTDSKIRESDNLSKTNDPVVNGRRV